MEKQKSLEKQIEEMRGFLWACHVTEYLLPDQIRLLTMALDALERETKSVSADAFETGGIP